jgi:hypothetical protein
MFNVICPKPWRRLKTPGSLALIAGLVALILAGVGCTSSDPYKAGEGGNASLKTIPHNAKFGGIAHAEGMCQAMTYCSACHGANLQGGTNGEPSCTKCHVAFWTDPNCGKLRHTVDLGGHRHAPNYCQALEHCTACHGADLKGGSQGQPSCYSCHGAVWNSPTCGQNPHTVNLGGVMHAPNSCQAPAKCSGCHGADLRGGTSGEPSCYSCHGAVWSDAKCGQNPHTVKLGGVMHAPNFCQAPVDCTGCHGSDLRGGTGGEPSCYSCHGQVWTLPNCGQKRHTVNQGGHLHAPGYCKPVGDCSLCHGADLRGGHNGEPSCYSCHADVWNNSNCGQNNHTVNLGGVYHGANYCRPYQNCASCHGSNLRGGTQGQPSCLSCHTQRAWFTCSGHTHSMDGHLHATGYCTPYANCVFCHGDNLQGGPNGEPKCTQCHSDLWTGGCGNAKAIKR